MSMQKINKLRGDIAALKTQIAGVEQAALTNEQIEARVDGWFDSQARYLDDDFYRRAFSLAYPLDGSGQWAALDDVVRFSGEKLALALTVTLNREKLRPALINAAQGHAAASMQVEDKGKELASLRAKLYELECAEEAEIERLEAAGETVYRRGDADPLAILGLGSA